MTCTVCLKTKTNMEITKLVEALQFIYEIIISSIYIKKYYYIVSIYTSNHTLRIETGRHERKLNSVSRKLELLPRCERLNHSRQFIYKISKSI